jgi:hypothetical protein
MKFNLIVSGMLGSMFLLGACAASAEECYDSDAGAYFNCSSEYDQDPAAGAAVLGAVVGIAAGAAIAGGGYYGNGDYGNNNNYYHNNNNNYHGNAQGGNNYHSSSNSSHGNTVSQTHSNVSHGNVSHANVSHGARHAQHNSGGHGGGHRR